MCNDVIPPSAGVEYEVSWSQTKIILFISASQ